MFVQLYMERSPKRYRGLAALGWCRDDEGVRHKETKCAGGQRNGPKQTEEGIERTGAKPSGPKQTEVQTPLSGQRYRGSNPCLPATKPLTAQYLRTSIGTLRSVREATLFGGY